MSDTNRTVKILPASKALQFVSAAKSAWIGIKWETIESREAKAVKLTKKEMKNFLRSLQDVNVRLVYNHVSDALYISEIW